LTIRYLRLSGMALALSAVACNTAQAASDNADASSTLPAITVTNSRFAETFAQSLPQTTVITSDAIEQSGLTDVSQILQKLGNVPTRINLNGTPDLSLDLRGYGTTSDNNVVVLLDGVRLSEIEQATARVSMIPVESIDHIEIIRGGSSVLYGEGATSGIINIVSHSKLTDLATLSAGGGSFSTAEGNAYASRRIGDTSVALFGKSFQTDNYRDNNRSEVHSGGGSVIWQPKPDATLGLRFFADSEDTRFPGPLTLSQFQQNPRQTLTPDDRGTISGGTFTLFGSIRYGNTDFALDANARNKEASSVLPSLGGTTVSSADFLSLSPRAKVHDWLTQNNELAAGIDLSRWDRTYSSVYPAYPQYSLVGEHLIQNSSALYVRDDWAITDADRLVVGGRAERIQKEIAASSNFPLTAFEVQYTRVLLRRLEGYVRTGESYRVANIDEIRGAAGTLLPQTSMDYELGLAWDRAAPTHATLRVFRSDIRNELVFDPVQFINLNLPPTRRQGVELEGAYQLNPQLALRGSWQSIQALFVDGAYQGHRVPLVPRFNAQTGVEWNPLPNQALDLSARWVGDQPMDSDFLGTQPPIPFYWTADFRYSWAWTRQWTLFAAANNLMNRKYYDYANSYGAYYPSPGINFSASLKYRF
jgi:iron complex outermembrane receptor protein